MPAACDPDVADIEDIGNSPEMISDRSIPYRKMVMPRVRKRHKNVVAPPVLADSHIPGTQKIYLKTWGCSHNNSDGEYMAGQLANYGYTISEKKEEADLWVLNSCTVKSPAEDHFRNEINKARELGKFLVLAGCVPQGQQKADYIDGISVIGVQQIDRVLEVVEETLKGHTVRLFGQKKQEGKKTGGASLALPKIRKNPLIEIIAINTGCLNQCTYCKTKHARGELGSYQPDDIVARAVQSFEEGVVEIWLTSEDLGAYGHDIGVTLPELLWKLVEVIPEGAMMRLGMTNPPYILEHLEEMAKICNHPRVYSFLHVPVQSASDSVLMDMKREYCIDDFRHVVDFLKQRVPGITIATDVICGFPTETNEANWSYTDQLAYRVYEFLAVPKRQRETGREQGNISTWNIFADDPAASFPYWTLSNILLLYQTDFAETMKLVEEYKFPSLFINQYFPRPGTPAAKLNRIDTQEVKKRTKAISELFQSYQPYGHEVGQIQTVLVTEISHDKNYYVGHNKYYDQVLVPKDENLMGKSVDVEITSAGKHYLKCNLLGTTAVHRPDVPLPQPKGQVSGARPVQEVVMVSSSSSTREITLVTSVIVLLILAILIRSFYL